MAGVDKTKIRLELLAILGFVFAVVSVFVARWSKADGYELSIYASTPDIFWISIVICFLISLLLTTSPQREDWSGKLLMFLSFAIVIFLPILRGYYYIGEGDSLVHLGYTRSFLTNVLEVTDILYPGIHTLSVFLSFMSGSTVRFSLMFISLLFLLIFITSSFITIRRFIDIQYEYIGIFLPGLLLPVNIVSVHPNPHPATSATLYFPFLIFAYAKYIQSKKIVWAATNVLLFTGIVILHPQIAATVLLFYIIITLFNLVERNLFKLSAYSIISFLLVVINIIVFWMWSSTKRRFIQGVQGYSRSLFVKTGTATEVTQRGASLSDLGSSLHILATKLFLISLMISVISVVVVGQCFVNYSRRATSDSTLGNPSRLSTDRLIIIMGIGAVPVLGLFIFTLVTDITTQYFRYLGVIMTIATIISSFSIKYVHHKLPRFRMSNMVYIFVLVLMLVLSILVYFPSPYILQPNNQVTESQMEGYETGLSHSKSNFDIMFIRSPPNRYFEAQISPTGQNRRDLYQDSIIVPDHFSNQKLHQMNQTTYVAITRADEKREVEIYRGFRFTKRDFKYLKSSPGTNKVHSSGGVTFYLIE